MEHLSNDHEDHPNQHENSHKIRDEMGIDRDIDMVYIWYLPLKNF